jgi:hypothetical protein
MVGAQALAPERIALNLEGWEGRMAYIYLAS